MKRVFLLVVAFCMLFLVACGGPKWDEIFQVQIIDENVVFGQYLDGTIDNYEAENDYDIYEITNTTSNTYRDVTVVVTVHNSSLTGKDYDFSYESYIGTMKPGETVEYRLLMSDVYDAGLESGKELSFPDKAISEIKFAE